MALALRRPYRATPSSSAAAEGDTAGAARPARTRVAAARGAWAIGSVLLAIARLIRLAATIVFLIIAAGVVLRLVGANASNSIVHDIHSVGSTLVGPFKNVFTVKNAKESIALNWGLAAVVYLIVGHLIASFIARLAPTGVPPSRPVV